MQHLLPRWKVSLQADVGNSMDLKETSAAVLYEQLFNHITNNTKLHSSPWFSDTIHTVPIWINESLGFWGQEKDFYCHYFLQNTQRSKNITLPEIPLL